MERAPIAVMVFNGDADGIIAAHQLRLAGRGAAAVVTGVKRDIDLLGRVVAVPGEHVMVADISLDANRAALEALLARGVQVTWFDHHYAGQLPDHPHFHSHIDTAPDVCSSVLVDRYLNGRFRAWAVAAAFGDNLSDTARALGTAAGLDAPTLALLEELGTLINYNAYGETIADLLVPPAELYERIASYADPLQFAAVNRFLIEARACMAADLASARAAVKLAEGEKVAVHELPDAAWSRRVQGVWANELARGHPQRAHALLVAGEDGFSVSVRAPLAAPQGADAVCRQFATGGGRAGAAGINHLPAEQVDRFLATMREAFGRD